MIGAGVGGGGKERSEGFLQLWTRPPSTSSLLTKRPPPWLTLLPGPWTLTVALLILTATVLVVPTHPPRFMARVTR